MRERQPFKLNFFFKIHNFYLTAISGTLLLLFLEQLIPTITRNGVYYAICHYNGGWTQQLVVLYYVSAIGETQRGRCAKENQNTDIFTS